MIRAIIIEDSLYLLRALPLDVVGSYLGVPGRAGGGGDRDQQQDREVLVVRVEPAADKSPEVIMAIVLEGGPCLLHGLWVEPASVCVCASVHRQAIDDGIPRIDGGNTSERQDYVCVCVCVLVHRWSNMPTARQTNICGTHSSQ